jgi:hypothetical protein
MPLDSSIPLWTEYDMKRIGQKIALNLYGR